MIGYVIEALRRLLRSTHDLFGIGVLRLAQRFSFIGETHGFRLHDLTDRQFRHATVGKIDSALTAVHRYCPLMYFRLRKDIRSFSIVPISGSSFIPSVRSCHISSEWIRGGTIDELVCVIVHEGMHARLRSLGVSQKERERVERICWKAEDIYLKRRFDGDDEQILRHRRNRSGQHWTRANRRAAIAYQLDEVTELPGWYRKLVAFFLD